MSILGPKALSALTLLIAIATARPAAADWRRTVDLNCGTAFTLEQGMVEVGLLTPLSVGVTDDVQVALHPILLLLGQPYIALRWRATRYDDVTLAFNLGTSWSFIRREDAEGDPSPEDPKADLGFPGTLQLDATVTFRVGDGWLFSVGGGPAMDLLGARPIRGLAELHASIHALIDRAQLVMLQASTYIDVTGAVDVRRPLVTLMYAVALSDAVHLGAGLGFGRFIYEPAAGVREELLVFPVADIWFRL
ncbi:MAG: hypothetical protein CSA66_07915 [Proteobacteria bacterium]|nr:MAG: hypothetical protein CSA66_07915 [Pseudomonadota bacterium]